MYGHRSHESKASLRWKGNITPGDFLLLFVILYPINLFILARLLFPMTNGESSIIDFKVFYFENYRKIFLWTMVLNVLAIFDKMVNQYPLSYHLLPAGIMILLGTVSILKYENEVFHKTMVVVLLGLLLTILFTIDFTISLKQ